MLSITKRLQKICFLYLQNSTSNKSSVASLSIEYISQRDYYMAVYSGLSAAMTVTIFLSSFYAVFLFLRGSTYLHNAVFNVIFASPMSFFDTTPSGRILNRLTSDVDEIDNMLPLISRTFIQNVARILGIFVFIAISLPYFLIILVVMTILFGFLNSIYCRVIRAIKRVENVTRSPVYSHLSATAHGLATVRAYNRQEFFTDMLRKRLDPNVAALLYFHGTTRWFGTYIDYITVFCNFSVCIAVVLLKGHISPTIGSLCVSYSIRVSN